ncbi:MAG: LysE family translocator [Gammaproteobacteria bacterium]
MINFIPPVMFAVSTTLTPGPNNFMLLNTGLHYGYKKGLPLYLGIVLGFPMMMLIIALGLGTLFTKFTWIESILKIIGIIVMLYLASKIYHAPTNEIDKKEKKPFNFFQAVAFQWANPKAWVMAVSATSIFDLSRNYFVNALLISLIFLCACTICNGAWIYLGKKLQRFLKTSHHQKRFNQVMAVCLALSMVLMIFD